jgi:hypothetical protein
MRLGGSDEARRICRGRCTDHSSVRRHNCQRSFFALAADSESGWLLLVGCFRTDQVFRLAPSLASIYAKLPLDLVHSPLTLLSPWIVCTTSWSNAS